MEIAVQAEITLRNSGYETRALTGDPPAVICFENLAIIGFVYVFNSVEELLMTWESAQQAVLSRHGAAFRAAGEKAWNVYTILLCAETAPKRRRAVERIEENFELTRKIVRTGVRTPEDVERAVRPLTTIRAQPVLSHADFQTRLSSRLSDTSSDVLAAFFGSVPANELAEMLTEKS